MTFWEYGRLEADEVSGTWKLAWHGPGSVAAEGCNDDVAALNLAGAQGWELAGLAQSTAGYTTRYTFKRPRADGQSQTGQGRKPALASESVVRVRQFAQCTDSLAELIREFSTLIKTTTAQMRSGPSRTEIQAINTRLAANISGLIDRYAAQVSTHNRLALQVSDDIRARLVLLAATSDPSQADESAVRYLQSVKRLAGSWQSGLDQVQLFSSSLETLKARSPALAEQVDRLRAEIAKMSTTRELVEQWLRDLDDIG